MVIVNFVTIATFFYPRPTRKSLNSNTYLELCLGFDSSYKFRLVLQHLLPHQKMIGAIFSTSYFICVCSWRAEIFVAIATGNDENVVRVGIVWGWAALCWCCFVDLDGCQETNMAGVTLWNAWKEQNFLWLNSHGVWRIFTCHHWRTFSNILSDNCQQNTSTRPNPNNILVS